MTDVRLAGAAVAFPLGGVGTGTVSLAADGALKQWQIHNQVNHRGDVPETLFAIRASSVEPPSNHRRVLRARPAGASGSPAPLVTDHEPAPWSRTPAGWEPVASTDASVEYPYARVAYADPELPLRVTLEAHTPFVPIDLAASSLPLISYRFSVANAGCDRLHGFLVGSLLNTIGWDGATPIDGAACPLLGGGVNRVRRKAEHVAVVMDNPSVGEDDPAYGSLALWTDAPAAVLPRAHSVEHVLRWVDSLKLLGPTQDGRWDEAALRRAVTAGARTLRDPVGPSPAGRGWVGALACAFSVAPGETAEITIVHAWWLPNRVVNFDQFGPQPDRAPAPAWLGNHYATPFSGAEDVVDAWRRRRVALDESSRAWARVWTDTTLDATVAETLAAQPALVRSPSLFVAADGTAFGFEGGLGASTLNWNGDVGGSCPLNCTHVFNYEQALAALFPGLERTMRTVEWERTLAADGSLPHRVLLPLDGPQLQGVPIGGPLEPALDGMLGAVLKTYREARIAGDRSLLERWWPRMERLMGHVTERWDDGAGVLRGRQPVTFDIELTGPNMFVGSLWLAALRTMAAVAGVLGDAAAARGYAERCAGAARAYDELLWNGDYYGQAGGDAEHDFGDGCLSDQLVGQWWAHQLGLGHLLPLEHVRSALAAVVRHNLRDGFAGFEHGYRVFADGDDRGLLVCSWPRGGRPAVPIRYADEVWSGSEYQVAAHCLFEGLDDEAARVLAAARGRQSGARRNPFNEIECGDHYVRAMSGWSLLAAATGFSYDALTGHLRLSTRPGHYPFVTGQGWGTVEAEASGARLTVRHGTLMLREITSDRGAASWDERGSVAAREAVRISFGD
jgi:non-lysosomal glucosylceramidase